MSDQVRCKGTVKFFSIDKGFGFITCPAHSKDIFIHKSNLTKSGIVSLNEGDKVTFVVNEGQKGSYATNVLKE